jgi:serine/threonine protein kinase/heme exporter protein D
VRHSIFRANAATLRLPCWYDDTDVECVGSSACPLRIETEEDLKDATGLWRTDRDTALEQYGAIEAWDTSRLSDLGLFSFSAGANFNEDVSRWDTGQVTNLVGAFFELVSFNQDLSKWDTANVGAMTSLFDGASSFNQDLNRWQTTDVTMMRAMFSRAELFNGNVGDWDTSRVVNAERMFLRASRFNQSLSKWDVSKLTNVNRMFDAASSFNADISAWTPRRFAVMERFLSEAVAFNQDLSCWAAYFQNRNVSFYCTENCLQHQSVFPQHIQDVPCWFNSSHPRCTTGAGCPVVTLTATDEEGGGEQNIDLNVTQSDDGQLAVSSNTTEPNTNMLVGSVAGAAAGATFAVLIMVAVAVLVRRRAAAAAVGDRRAREVQATANVQCLQHHLDEGRSLLRRLKQGAEGVGDASAAKLVRQIARVSKERAEARFVIDYRQLVTSRSMEEFRRDFQRLEVPRASVAIGKELGKGQSGVVLMGELVCESDSRGRGAEGKPAGSSSGRDSGGPLVASSATVAVAVKSRVDIGTFDCEALALASSTVADEALLLEAMLLNGLRHPGLLQIVAVVTESAPMLLCTELMPNGDLRKFLRACRPSKSEPLSTVTTADMVSMASVLASAMAFLERQSIIHRDIAARNVLVGATNNDVKVADLGAARNVHRTNTASENGVYTATTNHNPARWMALESLRKAHFSHKSDVFAFGVLLWEILSMGQTPWGAFGISDFVAALQNGDRLQFPAAVKHDPTAQVIYGIALRCWSNDPRKRPLFSSLDGELATHRIVAKATTTVSPSTVALDRRHYPQQPLLDSDGYVSELAHVRHGDAPLPSIASHHQQQPLLAAKRYVNDSAQISDAAGNECTVLHAESYVEEHPQKDLLHEDIGNANGRECSHSVTALQTQPQLSTGGSAKDVVADVVV